MHFMGKLGLEKVSKRSRRDPDHEKTFLTFTLSVNKIILYQFSMFKSLDSIASVVGMFMYLTISKLKQVLRSRKGLGKVSTATLVIMDQAICEVFILWKRPSVKLLFPFINAHVHLVFVFLQNFNIKLFALKNSQEETDTKSTLIWWRVKFDLAWWVRVTRIQTSSLELVQSCIAGLITAGGRNAGCY